ncbi:hypothetical protein QFZ41_002661 [Luteibacter sp. W1I16]
MQITWRRIPLPATIAFLCAAGVGAVGAVSTESSAPQAPHASSRKQAYADELIKALDRYEHEIREHKDDDPRSSWLVWPGQGYKLPAVDDKSISLLALRDAGAASSFDVAVGTSSLTCDEATKTGRRVVVVGEWSAVFESRCVDGIVMFRPVRKSDQLRLQRIIEAGGQTTVKSMGMSGTFDLKGVALLKAMIAAEAVGLPPAD